MLHAIGAGMILTASTWMGFCAIGELRQYIQELQDCILSLEVMERELTNRLASVPQLLELAANSTRQPVQSFYLNVKDRQEKVHDQTFSTIWAEAVEDSELSLTREELNRWIELGSILGRYDVYSQTEALRNTREHFIERLRTEKEKQRKMGKIYHTLGISIGIFIVILFL